MALIIKEKLMDNSKYKDDPAFAYMINYADHESSDEVWQQSIFVCASEWTAEEIAYKESKEID
mgnify:FL=1